VAVEHVGVIEYDVERRDHGVGDAQVHEEVVGDGAHALVREHDPDNDEVAAGRHGDHPREQNRPDDLPPPGQDELVGVLVLELEETRVGRAVARELEELVVVRRPGRRDRQVQLLRGQVRAAVEERAARDVIAQVEHRPEQRLLERSLHRGKANKLLLLTPDAFPLPGLYGRQAATKPHTSKILAVVFVFSSFFSFIAFFHLHCSKELE
jgi:hypothetical protein